jgi:hypothetical protein
MCFPLNVSMVHSPKLTIITNGKHQTCVSLTLGEIICFSSLILSSEGNTLDAVFMGMAHSGSSSLHTILEDSTDVGNTTSSRGRSSSFPVSRECNVVTPSVPIMSAAPSEGTPTPLAITTVPLWTAAPQPYPMLIPEQQQPTMRSSKR